MRCLIERGGLKEDERINDRGRVELEERVIRSLKKQKHAAKTNIELSE